MVKVPQEEQQQVQLLEEALTVSLYLLKQAQSTYIFMCKERHLQAEPDPPTESTTSRGTSRILGEGDLSQLVLYLIFTNTSAL
jgi:hypothetical protein